MSNFTPLLPITLYPVPDSKLSTKYLQEDPALSLEELAGIAQAKKALTTITYSPREATLQAIFDYAAGENTYNSLSADNSNW